MNRLIKLKLPALGSMQISITKPELVKIYNTKIGKKYM